LPKVQFSDLPRGVWQHLLERVEQRQVSLQELELLREWVRSWPGGLPILPRLPLPVAGFPV
jgi:hypothetical protein